MTKVHFRSYIHKKMILFPQRIDKDIAEDDPVRLLDALVDNLMLDNVYKLYKPSGRKPYHPQMMLKVILYAYMNNIYSCRRIESLLKRDIHFIYLAGYEQPDFITINRFRNRVKKEINNIFINSLRKNMGWIWMKLRIHGMLLYLVFWLFQLVPCHQP